MAISLEEQVLERPQALEVVPLGLWRHQQHSRRQLEGCLVAWEEEEDLRRPRVQLEEDSLELQRPQNRNQQAVCSLV